MNRSYAYSLNTDSLNTGALECIGSKHTFGIGVFHVCTSCYPILFVIVFTHHTSENLSELNVILFLCDIFSVLFASA